MTAVNGRTVLVALSLMSGVLLFYGFVTRINIEFAYYNDNSKENTAKVDNNDNNNNNKVTVAQVVIPLEEIKAINRAKAVDPLLQESVAADDERLVQAIRDHFIDPPSKLQIKMSNPLKKTPQAEAVEKVLSKKKRGFYIECGALDGERSSNTLYFEREMNWNGILIEMDPSWYRQVEGKNRNAYSMNACLSPHAYPIKMLFKESSEGTGQLATKRSQHTKDVYCFPLLSVMLAMNQTHIDYLSLDVEGFELEILKTIPFDKLDITTFSVEFFHLVKGGKEDMINFMKNNGYDLHSTINTDKPVWARDYIFVKKSK